ncbi:DNA alkylation repair protein [Treponema parvum]|uniref:DNA alkylation repair protein n=1 Tax=Treponema parvum TaxID=138851 RepID=UPI003209FA4B
MSSSEYDYDAAPGHTARHISMQEPPALNRRTDAPRSAANRPPHNDPSPTSRLPGLQSPPDKKPPSAVMIHSAPGTAAMDAGKICESEVQKKLFALQDEKYKAFNAKLVPTVDPETMIGIRTPALRKFAKEFAKSPQSLSFLKILPHKYFEENNLHGFIIETFNDYDRIIAALDDFLPYIDNWATCDSINPKALGNHLEKLLHKIEQWILSDHTYTVRFALGILMRFYLSDGVFCEKYLKTAASVRSNEYYVNMMQAWFFATALTKQYLPSVVYLEQKKLDVWTHNKAIQKALESFRIPGDKKKYLKTLKISREN